MERVRFGRTELQLSRLGMGCHSFGTRHMAASWDPFTEAGTRMAVRTVHAALDVGVNFFDTSPDYGNGHSERVLGRALRGRRDDVFLATKVDYKSSTGPEELEQTVLGSLERLGTDRLDVLQLHGGNYSPSAIERVLRGGVLETLCGLQRRGLVRHLGFTVLDPITALPLIERPEFATAQLLYHLGEQAAARHALPACASQQLGVTVMRPLSAGLLQDLLTQLGPKSFGREQVDSLCLRFVLSDPRVHVVNVGMRREREVVANAALVNEFRPCLDVSTLARSVGERSRREDEQGSTVKRKADSRADPLRPLRTRRGTDVR